MEKVNKTECNSLRGLLHQERKCCKALKERVKAVNSAVNLVQLKLEVFLEDYNNLNRELDETNMVLSQNKFDNVKTKRKIVAEQEKLARELDVKFKGLARLESEMCEIQEKIRLAGRIVPPDKPSAVNTGISTVDVEVCDTGVGSNQLPSSELASTSQASTSRLNLNTPQSGHTSKRCDIVPTCAGVQVICNNMEMLKQMSPVKTFTSQHGMTEVEPPADTCPRHSGKRRHSDSPSHASNSISESHSKKARI